MELIELIADYLGLPILRHGRPVQLYNMYMRRVGAIHHARFMAKAITLLKMALLHDKHQDNFTAAEWTQVNRLAEFVVLIYGRYFLQSALSSAAPRIDIGFLGDVLSYRPINNVISTSVKESFLNHLLYLCPELVVLAFFETDVPNHEKSAMARTLVAHQVHVLYPVGKPGGRHFEEIIPELAAFLFLGWSHWYSLPVRVHHRAELVVLPSRPARNCLVNDRPRRMARGPRVPFHV